MFSIDGCRYIFGYDPGLQKDAMLNSFILQLEDLRESMSIQPQDQIKNIKKANRKKKLRNFRYSDC
jgi:hypothetical protein